MESYAAMLLSGRIKLAIWGLGYLGYSDVIKYATNNVFCVISDYNIARIERIKLKFSPIDGLRNYLDHVPSDFDISRNVELKSSFAELLREDVLVHIIAVPTQAESAPSNKWLSEALKVFVGIKEIKTELPPVLIIESSLVPGTLDRFILPYLHENGLTSGENIHIGICSRTDWFDQGGRFVDTSRIVSGVDQQAVDITADIIEITGAEVIKTSDYRMAELIKSVEHSFYQMAMTMSNQLALGYPNLDIREMLRLSALRGGVPDIRPNFGSAGYEIPGACQYVLEGAEGPEYLSLFREANFADLAMPKMIADILLRNRIKKLAILGISSTANMKVTAMSHALRIISYVRDAVPVIKCFDPFYTAAETKELTGCDTFLFPEELSDFEAVVICSGHMRFRGITSDIALEKMQNCRLILDNMGVWEDFKWTKANSMSYRRVGLPGWNS